MSGRLREWSVKNCKIVTDDIQNGWKVCTKMCGLIMIYLFRMSDCISGLFQGFSDFFAFPITA
jgi:hypothetical protein